MTDDAGEATRARAALRRAGIYGTRVTIQHRPLAKLGHTDNLYNLAVSSELYITASYPAIGWSCCASSGQAAVYWPSTVCLKAAWPNSSPARPL
ncbi:MAG: hypothetical protein Ct9H300mP32_2300 [Verrucomicrobiota bacterium]|nr:MAG: hypothetical protein Ct9H300mP32_2300 [Verrucomicrobiota bacterium]